MSTDDLRQRFAAFCGPDKYREFLTALKAQDRPSPRLRYWQERLWLEFAEQDGASLPKDPQAVVALFADEPLPEEPPPALPDKAEFLDNPLGLRLPDQLPAEWLREGWQRERFRDDVSYCLARSVSKVGDFALAGDVWLTSLPGALDATQVVDLYLRIRDESQRLETEWRPAFEAAFSGSELPASRDGEVVVGALRHMIETGTGQAFPHLVAVLVQLSIARDQLDPANSESLLALAQKHQRTAMASILEEARRNLEQRDLS